MTNRRIPSDGTGQVVSRRALFGPLGGWTASPRSPGAIPAAPSLARRLLVDANQGCCNHQICVALCPGKALLPYGIDGRVGIALAVERCTGCGTCVETCPEQALSLRAVPRRDAADYLILTAHTTSICRECDEPFVAHSGEDLCPLCRKDRTLFGDLARGLRP
jgi:Pyruvate/2-oxoacid:ferredoxin oxidoreductase delta subunit